MLNSHAQSTPLKSLFCLALFLANFAIGFSHFVVGQDPFDLPRIMDAEPGFEPSPTKIIFSKELMPLWLEALNSDNVELQRRAAETIVLAKRRRMTGLNQAAKPLLSLFQKENVDGSVRRAVANALTSIDAMESAIVFSRILATTNDIQLQSICETAIANWKSDCMVSEWRERLVDSSNGTTTRVLAIRGLAKLCDSASIRTIYDVVLDEKEPFAVSLKHRRRLDGFLKQRTWIKQRQPKELRFQTSSKHQSVFRIQNRSPTGCLV